MGGTAPGLLSDQRLLLLFEQQRVLQLQSLLLLLDHVLVEAEALGALRCVHDDGRAAAGLLVPAEQGGKLLRVMLVEWIGTWRHWLAL